MKGPISDRLRDAIADSRQSGHALAELAGVAPTQINRFVAGSRSLSLESADRIAGALGLKLVETVRRGRPATRS